MSLGADEHDGLLACPVCEASSEWVCAVLDAYEWTGRGQRVDDVVPSPTAAIIDGVLLLTRELRAAEVYEMDSAIRR
jgi:hypothetical protein